MHVSTCVYTFLQMCEHLEAQVGWWEPFPISFTPYSQKQGFSINPEVTDVAGLLASLFCDFPISFSQGWDYWWAALGTWTPVPSLAWWRCGSLNNNSQVTLHLLICIYLLCVFAFVSLYVNMHAGTHRVDTGAPGTRVTGICEPLCRFWRLNPDLQQNQ